MIAQGDTDGDGQLSRDEFIAAFGIENISTFEKMDMDNDGMLTEAEADAVEVGFLEFAASWKSWLLMLLWLAVDYASLLNPIMNATGAQQGEFRWASQNLELVDMMGMAAIKLELGVFSAIVSIGPRVLLGEEDTDLDTFCLQTLVLFVPALLGKMGYGFEVNSSTLVVIGATVIVALLFAIRSYRNPKSLSVHASDGTLATLAQEQRAGTDAQLVVALCGNTENIDIEEDWVCQMRRCLLRDNTLVISRPAPTIATTDTFNPLHLISSKQDNHFALPTIQQANLQEIPMAALKGDQL